MQEILDERCDSDRSSHSSESTGASADHEPTTQQVQRTGTVRGRGRGRRGRGTRSTGAKQVNITFQ